MISLRTQKQLQAVRDLPFCYLCGALFTAGDHVDHDHVPPRSFFRVADSQPSLKLKTHTSCHKPFSTDDQKFAQLVAMRRREYPRTSRDHVLRLNYHADINAVALDNLQVDAAVWRWIKGFHAALYRAPLLGTSYGIQTPFPRGDVTEGKATVRPILPQHFAAVRAIKYNRSAGSLDSIVARNGKLRYECVWSQADAIEARLCIFALEVYDWKDLGYHSDEVPARGCCGIYMLSDRSAPSDAALDRHERIEMPNADPLDPFTR